MAGSAVVEGDTITVQGAGTGIGGTTDQFQFAFRSVSGDLDIRVRVADLWAGSPGGKAGLMVRESLTASARNAFILLSPSQGTVLQARTRDGRRTTETRGPASAAPTWLRLVRVGNTFRAYTSPTGSGWTLVGSVNIGMGANAYVGLAVTSGDPAQVTAAAFTDLALGSSSTSLPSPWESTDVGNPAVPGGASARNGTFTVVGAGRDIWKNADEFHFAYQRVTGDTEIIAQLASLQAPSRGSKAGLMIRESLTGPAPHASMFAVASGNWMSIGRLFAGDMTYQAAGSTGNPPGWLRLVREGDLFSAYESRDGRDWTLVDTETIPMPQTVYVGLAVTSRNASAVATAVFTDVAIGTPVSGNEPPTVSITAPTNAAQFDAPASIDIAATAADTDGTVARVEFYAGTRLVGSDTTAPFAILWNDVVEGTYSLTAVATDDGGDRTMSAPVSVTVGTNKPPTVSITSPAGGATYEAPASVAISAAASDTDGSVAKVDFYAGPTLVGSDGASPFDTTWNDVPAGTYSLTAVATDDKGNTTTSPAVSVTVTGANKAPTVAITGPSGGATFTAPASIAIAASASDPDGSVARVDFYSGTQMVGSDSGNPYSRTWSNVAAGTYTLTAVATDDKGMKTTSAPVTVTVNANSPPTVAITGPGSGASYVAPANVGITASASDGDGTVVKVDFYAGGQLVGSDTSSPYSVVWGNVAAGSYSLTAVATDNAGGTATSAPVGITVTAPAPAPTPTSVTFVPGSDYATNVDSWTVQLRRATDPVSATPVATRNLGKPAVVGGEVTVDISTLVDPLATGSYYAVIVSTGPGGSTSSTPSPSFTK